MKTPKPCRFSPSRYQKTNGHYHKSEMKMSTPNCRHVNLLLFGMQGWGIAGLLDGVVPLKLYISSDSSLPCGFFIFMAEGLKHARE